MSKKRSQAVEVLPGTTVDWLVGSVKTSTCKITKNGRNIALPRVKQPNKTGGEPKMFTGARDIWRAFTDIQKNYWQEIAREKEFRAGWNAFLSSFFRSVAIHGIEYTMSHDLNYIHSDHRAKKQQYLINSLRRLGTYQVKEKFYSQTQTMLALYPVAFASPHIHLRLEDLNDINNALTMKWLLRTDDFLEYDFTPIESNGSTEKGSYILRKTPRQGQELYQLIQE